MASKVLVADDSIVIQKSIGITFAQEDYAVEFVGNGEDALQKLETFAADLVLADVTMPKMGGIELCEKLRALDGTQNTPVLLLAGANDAMTEGKMKACGANGYIDKPFDSNELLLKVKALIDQGPVASASNAATEQPASMAQEETDHPLGAMDDGLDIQIPTMDEPDPNPSEAASLDHDDFEPSSVPDGTAEFVPFSLDDVDDVPASESESRGPQIDFGASMPEEESMNDPFSAAPTKEMNINHHDTTNLPDDPFQADVPEESEEHESIELAQPVAPAPAAEPKMPRADQAQPSTSLDEASSNQTQVTPSAPDTLSLSEEQIENIVAKVFKNVIENIAWEVVPDMAENIIREEIQRLTRDNDTPKD
jgi:CheY-like chemotaxis protein